MKAVRASDSSGDAAIWPVERSQSSSCSAIGSVSQRSSRPAPRASAIWPSGTPSENSKRLEGAGRGFAFDSEAEKRALDFAAAIGHILRDDEQARVRIGGEPLFAPERAGGELGRGIGGLMEFDLRGSFAEGSLRAIAPRVEELLLRGQNAIETGEQKRSALGGILLERCNQFEREARGADEVARRQTRRSPRANR